MSQNPTFIAPEAHELASLFAGYAIEHLIACGGMGAVYKARQIALDREVAIKILPRELSGDQSFREGFAAEAKAMAKLNHPNLISVFDFGEADGMLFIIMEYVPGQSLYHATYNKRMEARQVAKMICDIGAGLHHAHEHGILHRDIKPANVLLDAQQRPKIGDFGLARPIGFANSDDETIYGTPHYTAPEIINEPQNVDARADIFSLGVMLHELLTGKMPADDKRLPSVICGCPKGFDAIIRKATAPAAAQRYTSVAAMVQDLQQVVFPSTNPRLRAGYPQGPKVAASRPATAALPRATARPTTTAKSKKSSNGNLMWFLVFAALVVAGAFYLLKQPEPTPSTKSPSPAPTTTTSAAPTNSTPTNAGAPKNYQPSSSGIEDGLSANPRPTAESRNQPTLNPPRPSNKPTTDGLDTKEMTDQSRANLDEKTSADAIHDKATPTAVEPPYDYKAFLLHAKEVMQEKSSKEIAARKLTLTKNIEAFGRHLERNARLIDSRENRRLVTESIELLVEKLKQDTGLIPELARLQLPSVPEISLVRDAYVQKQQEIEEQFVTACSGQAQMYIKGIELQIGRLNADQQQLAIDALNEEISKTRTKSSHFADVLLNREEESTTIKKTLIR